MSDKPPPKQLPTTAYGKPSAVPAGTGFGIIGMESGTRYLMSGAEAQQAENIIALFEQLKGRPATAEERAEVVRNLKTN